MKPASTYVLAICGYSGSGKSRVIEEVVRELHAEGWRLAVVKHCQEGLHVDRAASDTDRFYEAGAAVAGCGPGNFFVREAGRAFGLEETLRILGSGYDLVLAEGFKNSELPKVWMLRQDESTAPPSVRNVVKVLGWSDPRTREVLAVIKQHLPQR